MMGHETSKIYDKDLTDSQTVANFGQNMFGLSFQHAYFWYPINLKASKHQNKSIVFWNLTDLDFCLGFLRSESSEKIRRVTIPNFKMNKGAGSSRAYIPDSVNIAKAKVSFDLYFISVLV